jgi:hypothetical protein
MVTDLRALKLQTNDEWLAFFKRRQAASVSEWERDGGTGERPWVYGVDLDDDPFVRLCQRADYGMFYFGRPGGDPQLTFPRFEFLDALREHATNAGERALSNAKMIVDGVHATRWDLDRDHSFMSKMKLPKLIPFVVSQAHEKCKAIGHKLEQELRQAIGEKLSQLKALKGIRAPNVEIEPIGFGDYIKRIRRMLPSGRDESDGG